MVEYSLDLVFASLADPTRRDILKRVSKKELSVGEIARYYNLTFAAISKHLKVLEAARLIVKQRRGKEQVVHISPLALQSAADYLKNYEAMWNERFNRLEDILKKQK